MTIFDLLECILIWKLLIAGGIINSLEGIEFEERCLQISVYIDFPIAIERLLNDWICALCIGFVLSVLIFLLPNLTWSYFHFQFALRAFGRYI